MATVATIALAPNQAWMLFKDIAINNMLTRTQPLISIVKIESIREFKNSEKSTQNATRYYISSIDGNPEDFQKAIRSHWFIENTLHWMLDVAFSEDASRKRIGNATQNFSILSKIALNLLKKDPKTKVRVKSRRLKAALSNESLLKILNL